MAPAATTRRSTVHRCTDCGAESPKWAGRCPGCDAWNTLVEGRSRSDDSATAPRGPEAVAPLADVPTTEAEPRSTGVPELDRVLGGGLVDGSVTLVGGEPGVGKSTLLLQVAGAVARQGRPVLYVSAEEARGQVRARAARLGVLDSGVLITGETALPHVVDALDEHEPALVVVDSIQTVADPEVAAAPGTVGQVRECARRLVDEAGRRGCAIVLLGHVTKEGSLAGPRVLEHLVDTVLDLSGDRHHALRLLRAAKHRYGATRELGVFEMTGAGLEAVADASRLFLADRRAGAVGSVVVPTLDGHRPLLVEVQALTVPRPGGSARRETRGIDRARLAVLLAVLERRAGLPLADVDVYAVASGGARLGEPGVDLAVALSVASCLVDAPVVPSTVALGEIGLGGAVRPVAAVDRRLDEAARMGFETAVVPPGSPGRAGLETIEVPDLKSAMAVSGLLSAPLHRRGPTAPDEEAGRTSPWSADDQTLLADPRRWGEGPAPPGAIGGEG